MSQNERASIDKFHDELLKVATRGNRPLSPEIEAAFRSVPRHEFVRKFYAGDQENQVTPETLPRSLPAIYNDGALTIWKDTQSKNVSTMSQPSLVLRMLSMLRLTAGQRVFELGAASGWNAALLGKLVGPQGLVFSAEIIPELAEGARANIAKQRIDNVEIISGDGTEGYASGAPFDRVIFTAGSFDLPSAFFEQVKLGGLLLFVMRVAASLDLIFLFERKEDHFASANGMYCKFIPVIGRNASPSRDARSLESFPFWAELRSREVDRRPFAWGLPNETSAVAATGVRSFLEISEPRFILFKEEGDDSRQLQSGFFGLFDPDKNSLVLARKGSLISYGDTAARDALIFRLHAWVDYGMPSTASMNLRIYPASANPPVAPKQWIVSSEHTKLVWSA